MKLTGASTARTVTSITFLTRLGCQSIAFYGLVALCGSVYGMLFGTWMWFRFPSIVSKCYGAACPDSQWLCWQFPWNCYLWEFEVIGDCFFIFRSDCSWDKFPQDFFTGSPPACCKAKVTDLAQTHDIQFVFQYLFLNLFWDFKGFDLQNVIFGQSKQCCILFAMFPGHSCQLD